MIIAINAEQYGVLSSREIVCILGILVKNASSLPLSLRERR